MRSIIALLLGSLWCSPAAAQTYRADYAPDTAVTQRISQLPVRLNVGIRCGTINRAEARALRSVLFTLQRLDAR